MSFVEVWSSNEPEHVPPSTNSPEDDSLLPGALLWVKREPVDGKSFKKRRARVENVDMNFPWKLVSVLARRGDLVTVKVDGKIRVLRVSSKIECLPFEAKIVANMADMRNPNVPGILHNLKKRALSKKPYTFVGNVLISINPLRHIEEPSIVTSDDEYDWSIPLPPHPRSVAEKAFRQMLFTATQRLRLIEIDESNVRRTVLAPAANELVDKRSDFASKFGLINQTIIVTGESGSGKTEASKRVLQQLVERELVGFVYDEEDEEEEEEFQDRLLGSTMILESLGNASTNRNPNSSRFGSFLRLNYQPVYHDDSYSPSFYTFGASFTTYLLERSRVTQQSDGERNFNIFYELLTSPRKSIQTRLGFEKAKGSFRYLGYKYQASDRDRRGYTKLRTALSMANLGIKKRLLFEVVAAILHLGNVDFEEEFAKEGARAKIAHLEANFRVKSEKRGAVKKSSSMRDIMAIQADAVILEPPRKVLKPQATTGRKGVLNIKKNMSIASVKSTNTVDSDITLYERQQSVVSKPYSPFREVCKLLGVKQRSLLRVLLHKVVKAGNDKILTFSTVEIAEKKRDGLAKQLYALLFDWVVYVINKGFTAEPDEDNQDKVSFIGILDIFGFENFKKNSLEQLLINYANEVLLSLFIREIVIDESQLYKREGLLLDQSQFDDLSSHVHSYDVLIQVFEGSAKIRHGLFKIINSQRNAIDASDARLLSLIKKAFKKNEKLPGVHPSKSHSYFAIKHYANVVEYDIQGFLLKNNQNLSPELMGLLKGSTHEIVREFPKVYAKNSRKQSVAIKRNVDFIASRRNKKKSSAPLTVCSIFQTQLNDLRKLLSSTHCHYIRCVKPNPTLFLDHNRNFIDDALIEGSHIEQLQISTKRYHSIRQQEKLRKRLVNMRGKGSRTYFDANYVDEQLRNMGIYDCVKVLRCGLQTRIPYSAFTSIFTSHFSMRQIPFYRKRSKSFRIKLYVGTLLELYSQGSAVYKLGKTKVFFPTGELEQFQEILSAATASMNEKGKKRLLRFFRYKYSMRIWNVVFKKLKMIEVFKELLQRSRSASTVQKFVRKILLHKAVAVKITRRRAATNIQRVYRGFRDRRLVDNFLIEVNVEKESFSESAESDVDGAFDEAAKNDDVETLDKFNETDAFEANLNRYYQKKSGQKSLQRGMGSLELTVRPHNRLMTTRKTYNDLTTDWANVEKNLNNIDDDVEDSDDSMSDFNSGTESETEVMLTIAQLQASEKEQPASNLSRREMPPTRHVRVTVNKLNPNKRKSKVTNTVSFPEWRNVQLKPVKHRKRKKSDKVVGLDPNSEHDVKRIAKSVWGTTLRRVKL